jgi:hypothetical protein
MRLRSIAAGALLWILGAHLVQTASKYDRDVADYLALILPVVEGSS